MITNAAAEMEALADRVSGLRQTQQHGQALTRRQQSVGRWLENVVRARSAVRLISSRLGSDALALPPSTSRAREQIDAWTVALDEDLSTALGGDGFAALSEAVQRAVNEIESQAAGLWKQYVLQHAPHASTEILEALANDPRAHVAVLRIRRLAGRIDGLRERNVPTVEEINDFDDAARELHEAWATLDVETIAAEVVSFLRAANSDGGAPIASLTAEVLRWLDERGATRQYVVRPAD